MTNAKVDSALIRQLAGLLHETDLSEIELAEGDFRVRVARTLAAPITALTAGVPSSAPAGLVEAGAPSITPEHPGAVCSPMVGNLYRSARPGAEPFIKVGDKITVGQTLFIVEAMKVMNPIPAARAGTVREILVQDNQPVEYNEVLAVID